MRKIAIVVALILSLALMAGMVAAAKDTPVKVVVDCVKKDVKPAAFLRGKTVYLPLRATADLAKATISYDKDKKVFTVTSGKRKTSIKESQGIRVKGQFMTSFDLMSQALECNMSWDKADKVVSITTKKAENQKRPPSSGG